jgi:hypothetical protein
MLREQVEGFIREPPFYPYAMGSTIGDDTTPVFRFDWDGGSSRRTDEGIDSDERNTSAIETLAELGREDPECEVTLVSFE